MRNSSPVRDRSQDKLQKRDQVFFKLLVEIHKTSAGEIKKGTGTAVLPGPLVNVHDERE